MRNCIMASWIAKGNRVATKRAKLPFKGQDEPISFGGNLSVKPHLNKFENQFEEGKPVSGRGLGNLGWILGDM